eukprot:GEMP01025862.1.p1 GENE.GEMP01025862.1~~GEMP01025862.1.p1  ORF type:complete len:580 (+),score=165.44 GEMP01025862.1:199-1938(+)
MRGEWALAVHQAIRGKPSYLRKRLNKAPHPLHVMAVLKELRHHPHVALSVFHSSTLALDAHMLTALLHLCRDLDAQALFSKWTHLQQDGVVQTAFLRALSPPLAVRAFAQRPDWSATAQAQVCLKALRALPGRDGLLLALECMRTVHPPGDDGTLALPLAVTNVLLHACSTFGAVSIAKKLYDSIDTDHYSATAMFLLAARVGSEKLAEDVYARARELRMDSHCWAALLKVYAVTRNARQAWATLQLIPDPTFSHYQVALSACRNGDVDVARRIFAQIAPNRMALLWYLSALEHAKRPLHELLPVLGTILALRTTAPPAVFKFRPNVALAPLEDATASCDKAFGPQCAIDDQALRCVADLRTAFPTAKVRAVGTRAAPEFMREHGSDVDIVVQGLPCEPIKALVDITERMVYSEGWHLHSTAFSANVPLVRFCVRGDLVEVTCDNPLPIRKTKMLSEWARLPSVAYSVRAVKEWGAGRGADGFTLALMVIFVAQVRGVAPSGEEMLSTFFDFYRNFDFANECVSIRLGCRARKRDLDYALSVEDPVIPHKDLLGGVNEEKMLSFITALQEDAHQVFRMR